LVERCPEADPSRTLVLSLERLAGQAGSATVALGGGWYACKSYDRLVVRRKRGEAAGGQASAEPIPLPFPGEALWRGLVVGAHPATDGYRAPDPRREAFVDARALDGPLGVRAAVSGDVMRPLGGPGRRSLQDILVDLRVPVPLRAEVPVVLCGDHVVWLGGLVISQESRIVRDTERVVRLSVGRRGA
jgi:tRNA(Ile)-lysidine synthetase-like protein